MEFFGITYHGPQNYLKDCLKNGYLEPLQKEDVMPILKLVEETSTLSKKIERPNVKVIRQIDCYIGRVDGFAYGSTERFDKMKRKGVIKPVGPCDMYRNAPTTSIEYGWWMHDPALTESNWFKTCPRFPQPASPNSLILDIARKNDKYASFF